MDTGLSVYTYSVYTYSVRLPREGARVDELGAHARPAAIVHPRVLGRGQVHPVQPARGVAPLPAVAPPHERRAAVAARDETLYQ